MNNLKDAKNELINTVTNNVDLVAWLVANFGVGTAFTVIESQREVEQIDGNEFPAFILEIGDDADLGPYMIGSTEQDVTGNLFEFSIAWYENDRTKLLDQRLELIRLVKDALSANKKLNNGSNNTVNECRLSSFQNDKTIFFPQHFMNFVVYIDTNIN